MKCFNIIKFLLKKLNLGNFALTLYIFYLQIHLKNYLFSDFLIMRNSPQNYISGLIYLAFEFRNIRAGTMKK